MNAFLILQSNLPVQIVQKAVPPPEMSLFELMIKGGLGIGTSCNYFRNFHLSYCCQILRNQKADTK